MGVFKKNKKTHSKILVIMKTKFITLITIAALTLGKTSATFAANKGNEEITTLTDIGHINAIEAKGNVEIYITNGNKDGVKVFDNYYGKNALVQTENGKLRITSYNAEKLVVLVTVTDLRSIKAYNNAVIKSEGTLSALELNVELNDNAGAQLKLDALAASFKVEDSAKADISGIISDYELNYSRSSSVNRTSLTAFNAYENITTPIYTSLSGDNYSLARL